MRDPYLGEFEQIVLLAILRLKKDDAYAVPVREEIEGRTTRSVARGALYTALDRLEAKHFLTSKMGEPLAERGGPFTPVLLGDARRRQRTSRLAAQPASTVERARVAARTIMTPPLAPPRFAERLLSAVLGSGDAPTRSSGTCMRSTPPGRVSHGASRSCARMAGTRGRRHASAVTLPPGRRPASFAAVRLRRHFHVTETRS